VVQLQVAGEEQVTVPAGTFETVRLEMSSADGSKTTLWVAKDSHRLVKASSVSMAMNGATITSELQK